MVVDKSTWAHPSLVVVTGCDSFYGSHVAYQLLEQGLKVRGTVWQLDAAKDVLCQLPNASTNLTVVEADLLVENDWPKAMKDAEVVIHCAAPVIIDGLSWSLGSEKNTFFNSHVTGTVNVLKAALAEPTMRRFCHCSSVAAVAYGHDEHRYDGHRPFTEEDFSDFSEELNRAGFAQYAKSKTEAERAVWRLAMGLDDGRYIGGLPSPELRSDQLAMQKALQILKSPRPEVVVICPGIMYGPFFGANQSVWIQYMLKNALYGNTLVPAGFAEPVGPYCDVRDAALMMVCAALMPCDKVVNQRFIAVESNMKLSELSRSLRAFFGNYGFSKKPFWWIPSQVGTLVAAIGRLHHAFDLLVELRRDRSCSNTKAIKVMGVEFRPIEDALRDSCLSLMKLGIVESRGTPRELIDNLEFYNGSVTKTSTFAKKSTNRAKEGDKIINHGGDLGPTPSGSSGGSPSKQSTIPSPPSNITDESSQI